MSHPLRHLIRARRPARRAAVLLGLATIASLQAAGAAKAKSQYHVFMCNTPAGHHVPLDGFNRSWTMDWISADENCGAGGNAVIALGSLGRVAGNRVLESVSVPDGLGIAAATMTRRVLINPGAKDENAVPEWVVFRDSPKYDDEHRLESCTPYHGCSSIDWPSGSPRGWSFAKRATSLHWMLHCGGDGTCGGTSATPDGPSRAIGEVQGLHLLMEDGIAPATTIAGQLMSNLKQSGVVQADISGTDGGAGVYQAIAFINGRVVGNAYAGGDSCRDKGNVPGELDFEQFAPCPRSVEGLPLQIDFRGVANGPQMLSIIIRDAAGNETPFTKVVTVDNPVAATPTPAPTPTPAAAPPAASSRGTATVTMNKPRMLRGRCVRLSGLVTFAGRPAADVAVDVQMRSSGTWRTIGTTRSDARGRWTFKFCAHAGLRLTPGMFRGRPKVGLEMPAAGPIAGKTTPLNGR